MSASLLTIDFYAYWNGDSVASLFQMLAGLTNTSDYMQLLKCTALLSLIAAAVMACVRNRGGDIITWFAATVLFFMIAFVPRVTVNVVDVRALSAKAVENVPIGVGFTAGLTSTVGKWLAEAFETAFADVDAERFTKFGAAFPERVVQAIHKTGPILPETRALLDPFVEHCITPELLDDEGKLMELMNSTNLLATIGQAGWVNPSRFILANGKPLYCDAALVKLKTHLTANEIPAQEKLLFTKLSGSETALVEAALRKAIPEAQALLLGTSMAMNESLQHSMLMTAVPEGVLRTAGKDGSPIAASVQLSKSQGNMASEIAFRTMSEIASAFLPKLRNILEFIVIAAFPIVFLLVVAMGPSGGIVIRAYFTLFVWLMLWAPLAAVVNYLLVHIDANPMNRLVEQFGGVTMQSADLIRDLGASSQAMAGYLILLIPVVSFMLARASEMSASSLASSVMAPAGSAAQAQSANLAMGNISGGNASLGNVSAGNTNMHKTDMSDSFTAGSVSKNNTPYGTVVRNNATGAVTAMRVESSNLGFSAQGVLSQGQTNESSTAAGKMSTFTQGLQHANVEGSTETSSSSQGFVEGTTNVRSQSIGSIDNKTKSFAKSDVFSVGQVTSFGRTSNVSETFGVQSQVGFGTKRNQSQNDSVPINSDITEGISGSETSLDIGPILSTPLNQPLKIYKSQSSTFNRSNDSGSEFFNSSFNLGIGGSGSTNVSRTDQSNNSHTSSSNKIENLSETKNKSNFDSSSYTNANLESANNEFKTSKSNIGTKSNATTLARMTTDQTGTSNSIKSNESETNLNTTDMSPLAIGSINDSFSSPEEALAWLSDANNRKSFAKSFYENQLRGQSSLRDGNRSFQSKTEANQNRHPPTEDINQNPIAQNLPTNLMRSIDNKNNQASEFKISNETFLNRGIRMATVASFDNEGISFSGISSVLVPIFKNYQSPEDRSQYFAKMANEDPNLKNNLIEIGKSTDMSSETVLKKLAGH